MSLFAADAVYDMSAAGFETFEGAGAIRRFVEDWHRSWEDYRYEEEELLDLGHGVVLSVLRDGGRLADPDEARAAAERLVEERA